MTRGGFLELLMVAPAMARQALTEGKWLTIATPGWNRNNRKYSEEALTSMTEQMRGRMVIKKVEDLEPISRDEDELIKRAVGVVDTTRRGANGSVQVQVKWFGKAGAVHGVLCPAGLAWNVKEVSPGHHEIHDYEAQCLELSEWSGWEEATTV